MDIMLHFNEGGRHKALEVTVIESLQARAVDRAATGLKIGLSLQTSVEVGQSWGIRFIPVVVDSLGEVALQGCQVPQE